MTDKIKVGDKIKFVEEMLSKHTQDTHGIEYKHLNTNLLDTSWTNEPYQRLIGFLESLENGSVITESWLDRLWNHYMPNFEEATKEEPAREAKQQQPAPSADGRKEG